MKLWPLLLLGVCLQTACQSKTQKTQIVENALPGKVITRLGHNTLPAISPDGRSIAFVSERRANQKNSELYIFHRISEKEERLTHQDGMIADLVWTPQRDLIFTSTTDEMKERSALLFPELKNQGLPLTDLYVHAGKVGDVFERLTRDPGYIGDLSFQGSNMLALKEEGNHLILQEWAWPSRKTKTLLKIEERISSPVQVGTAIYYLSKERQIVRHPQTPLGLSAIRLTHFGSSMDKLLAQRTQHELSLLDLKNKCWIQIFLASQIIHSFDYHEETRTLALSLQPSLQQSVQAAGPESEPLAQIVLRNLDADASPCLP